MSSNITPAAVIADAASAFSASAPTDSQAARMARTAYVALHTSGVTRAMVADAIAAELKRRGKSSNPFNETRISQFANGHALVIDAGILPGDAPALVSIAVHAMSGYVKRGDADALAIAHKGDADALASALTDAIAANMAERRAAKVARAAERAAAKGSPTDSESPLPLEANSDPVTVAALPDVAAIAAQIDRLAAGIDRAGDVSAIVEAYGRLADALATRDALQVA